MEINEIIHGFKLLKKAPKKDLDSVFYEFKHIKSGASLVYLENNDENKCFAIGFRTLPEDSTGVCHIIEHSLLCGSKKYPLKEPFVNLLKGSMATFLNAMTAQDFTIYPVASQNNKDFNNLISVYLDAALNPLSVIDNKAFLQEGWHLEMNSVDDVPSYKGVVYNEMKGAMSSVDEQLTQKTLEVFYKGTCYGLNSGGEPDDIPNLTYEYYQNFYHKYYHPSNAMIYLYGKMDLSEKLAFINDEYLKNYDVEPKITIPVPKPVINRDVKGVYAIGQNEELKDNTYISLCFALDKFENMRDLTAFQIINDALMGSNEAPLKKALLEANLGQEISCTIDTDNVLPAYHIYLQKTNPEQKDAFYNTFINAVKKLCEEGINKDLLKATINNSLFAYKEMDSGTLPKGFAFLFDLMQAYNYDVDYEKVFETTENFNYYKQELDNNYFEKLLEKYILNSKHYVEVVLEPSQTLAQEKALKMQEKMEHLKNTMSQEEKEECVRITQDLIKYQSKEDSLEDLQKLPKLTMADISEDVPELATADEEINGIKFIKHEFNTKGIGYLKLYFDLKVLTEEELQYVQILSMLLGRLDTENYQAMDLQNQIKMYLGTFSVNNQIIGVTQKQALTKVCVTVSSLNENISYMQEVLEEILLSSKYDKKKINQNLLQLVNVMRSSIIENGMNVAVDEVCSNLSLEGKLKSLTRGVRMYRFLNNLVENFEQINFEEKFKNIAKKFFSKHNLIASVSGDSEAIASLIKVVTNLKLSDVEYKESLELSEKSPSNRAIIIPSEVNYNAKAINLKDHNLERKGALAVVRSILDYGYLWNEVRVKGGAYGCFMRSGISNDIVLASYRDPNVNNTYNTYDKVCDYLSNLELTEDELVTYKIGTLGQIDQPMSNSSFISISDTRYLAKINKESRMKWKEQIKNTTLEDIHKQAEIFRVFKEKGLEYTVGNKDKVSERTSIKEVETL